MPPAGERRLSFAELQRWFLARVTAVQREGGGSVSAPPPAATEVIVPSAALSADQRIDIYTEMYFLRLRRIMATEYPTVERLLGDDAFEDMARDYLTRFPPSDYTLRSLARALPYYLSRRGKGPDARLVADVCRLEHAVNEAFDTPSLGTITADALSRVAPDEWPEIRFRMDPSFRVLAFDYDAPGFVDAVHEQHELPAREPRRAWAVVWRRGHKIWRRAVSEPIHAMLSALAGGQNVTIALERGMEVWKGDEGELEGKVFQWFADWMNEGYFRSIVPPAGNDITA